MRPSRIVSVVLAAVCVGAPARAAAQAATVDQVLVALGGVVRDRAKQVATEALAAQLKSQICTHRPITVNPYPRESPEVARRAGNAAEEPRPIQLWLGGSKACAIDATGATSACTSDDVFVRSCRLAETGRAPLTDAYFLKLLSRDTIAFLLRVTSSNLDAEQYRRGGLQPVGDFVHSALEQVTSKGALVGSLAAPTLTLANELGAGLDSEALTTIGTRPATLALAKKVEPIARGWFALGCPFLPDPRKGGSSNPELGCTPGPETEHWVVDEFPAGCPEFLAGRDERTKRFKARIFAPGTPLAAASEAPCDDAWSAKGKDLCGRARLALNLHDALTALRCQPAMTDVTRRSTVRELIYILLEQDAYRSALTGLQAEAPGGVDALRDFTAAASSLPIDKLPREEIAYGVRVLGTYLAALREDPDGTSRWMDLLATDLAAFGPAAKTEGDVLAAYRTLLHGPALDRVRRPASPAVADLRDAVKDFLVLPALIVARNVKLTETVSRSELALASVVAQLRAPTAGADRLRASLAAFSELASALSRLSEKLADAVPAQPPQVSPAHLQQLAGALGEVAFALTLAADRDWVGLGIRAMDQLDRRVKSRPDAAPVLGSFQFIRVLLSTYQAQSVEEAKAIFQAALEDTGSRARRWDRRAVDVGALAGFRGGFQLGQTLEGAGRTYDRAGLYGLYAPFGVMTTSGRCGWMFYPIDLGSYLVATPSSRTEGAGPDWPDALRFGLVRFFRGKDVPVAFGVGADWRPPVERRVEYRAFVTLALELPLLLIY